MKNKHYHFYLILLGVLIFFTCQGQTATYTLAERSATASCFNYSILDKNKKNVSLPVHISDALRCATIVDLRESLLTFMIDETIIVYDLNKQKESKLFTIYPDMDGISNPVWSADRSQVMFVIINQEKKHGYKDIARIISLTLDKNLNVQSKEKYDRPVNFICGSICSAEPYQDFNYTTKGIIYRRNINIEERPGELELL